MPIPSLPIRHRAGRRFVRQLGALSLLLLTAACSTTKESAQGAHLRMDEQTVAVMTAVNADEAERLRISLLRGQPPPPSAQLFSIDQLAHSNPALGKIAMQLADCEISRPIPPTDAQTSTGFLVLQRGGDADEPCHGEPSTTERMSQWSDKAGELLLGLLVVGLAGFLVAAPFIFHVF